MTEKPFDQRKWWIIGTAVVLPILFLCVGYWLAGPQAVREEKAVERSKEKELAKGPALKVEVKSDWGWGGGGSTYIFPKKLTDGELDRLEIDYNKYNGFDGEPAFNRIAKHGGRRVGTACGTPVTEKSCSAVSRHKIIFTGNRADRVRIDRMRVRVISEASAPKGALIHLSPQGGGPPDFAFADLDSRSKVVLKADANGNPTNIPFTVAQNRWAEEKEDLVFYLAAATKRDVEVKWVLEVTVSYDGVKELITVKGDEGKPFVTTGWNQKWNYGTNVRVNNNTGQFESPNDVT
ncbi:hypothetical protein [Streptomyces sp. LNU-CPARS28]|uniref:hypothetical protein n=1 Tax=Streptomyces sp. LNU-CPARS28 TaxID=3137371 RepID=UPI00313657DC